MQDLRDAPYETTFQALSGGEAGSWRLEALSRPIQRVVLDVQGRELTVLNGHLKSKHGEFDKWKSGEVPAEDLVNYDPLARAEGAIRAALRRMGEIESGSGH